MTINTLYRYIMETIEIRTLVDITCTNVKRANQGSALEFEQYKNWTTLNQCIELRSIITYSIKPTVENIDIQNLGFGSKFKGKHRVWTWQFYPDRDNMFQTDKDPIGLLKQDVDQVPVIKNLSETINIDRAVFDSSNISTKNILFRLITGNV